MIPMAATLAHLRSFHNMLGQLQRAAGRTNVVNDPAEVMAQIDNLEGRLATVAAELHRARVACQDAGRKGLKVVS